ncbi:hydroxyisourate hydrolase [Alkalihalobacillus trypoxylicola]|uniref:5-hydroxyisourate hydrolase n=1 Tax=Alkalihalobacillus trypoxylicola TaxID=519424 RepID=A0A161P453_9BACI|nr:hydroxyisourate hydrolase [Alkalihalobacillus trypoxylicola]KYG26595.1 5-hydroxyisourate hydrolase [Alkalihalobacillus trypoxylicola]
MGAMTTHVLDTSIGKPAVGLTVELYKEKDGEKILLETFVTNSNGRVAQPLLEGDDMQAGIYELVFDVGSYYKEIIFLEKVPVRFTIQQTSEHYHIPLLISPGGYSTYRGS